MIQSQLSQHIAVFLPPLKEQIGRKFCTFLYTKKLSGTQVMKIEKIENKY